jgi:O-acetylserine/cysteine efflux transporter
MGQERLDAWRLAATLVAFSGVIVVFASELRARAEAIALLAVLGSATLAAFSSVLLRQIPPQPVIPTVALGCGASAVLLVPVSLLAGESLALPATWDAWGPVLYLAIAGSIGAFGLFTWLLNRWSASSVTLIGVIVPVVAVAVGAIVGGERLAWTTLAGGALVLAGVLAALLRARAVQRAGEGLGGRPAKG